MDIKNKICRVRRLAKFILFEILFVVIIGDHNRAYGHSDIWQKLELLSRAISNQSQSAELYLERGRVYAQYGKWDKAISDYKKAEGLNGYLENLDFLLGKALRSACFFEEAILRLDRYIIQHPKNTGAYLMRARTHADAHNIDLAFEDFEKVAKLAPNPDVSMEWAKLLVLANRPDEAIQVLQDGCSIMGPLIALKGKIIDIELSRKNYNAVLECIDTILANVSRKERWLSRRGDVLTKAGEAGAAYDTYAMALIELRSLPPKFRYLASTQTLERYLKQKLGEETNIGSHNRNIRDEKKN